MRLPGDGSAAALGQALLLGLALGLLYDLLRFLLWEHFLCRVKQGLRAFLAQIRAKKE